jgi:hypothetical protein
MSKELSHEPLTEEDGLPSQSSQCRFCDGQKDWDIISFALFLFSVVSTIFKNVKQLYYRPGQALRIPGC